MFFGVILITFTSWPENFLYFLVSLGLHRARSLLTSLILLTTFLGFVPSPLHSKYLLVRILLDSTLCTSSSAVHLYPLK